MKKLLTSLLFITMIGGVSMANADPMTPGQQADAAKITAKVQQFLANQDGRGIEADKVKVETLKDGDGWEITLTGTQTSGRAIKAVKMTAERAKKALQNTDPSFKNIDIDNEMVVKKAS